MPNKPLASQVDVYSLVMVVMMLVWSGPSGLS